MPSKTQWGIIALAALYGASQSTGPYVMLGSATGFALLFLFVAAVYNGTVTGKLKQWRARFSS